MEFSKSNTARAEQHRNEYAYWTEISFKISSIKDSMTFCEAERMESRANEANDLKVSVHANNRVSFLIGQNGFLFHFPEVLVAF